MRGHLQLVPRAPGTAYVSNNLWLPRSGIREQAVKGALQFFAVQGKNMVLEKMWEETEHHIICPREFVTPADYPSYKFPFVDLTPKQWPVSGLQTSIQFRDERQRQAYEAMCQHQNGILNLAPGRGKTVLALAHAVTTGCPALVVVHNTYLMEQWQERIAQFLTLPAGARVGIIQESTFDWKQPIAVAMIHTLANLARKGTLPPEFFTHFGIVYYDEVHHLAAPFFVTTAPLFLGQRYGLTATDKRTDGLEFVYNYHLGGTFYRDLLADLTPRVYFQQTPTYIDLKDKHVHDVTGQVNISKLRSALGEHVEGNKFRAQCIQEALNEGRKALAVGHSKKQLQALHQVFPDSALIIAETPQNERTRLVQNSRLTFAISKLGVEGLDDEKIDVLFFLTPFSNENELIQALGRIQRAHTGKKQPVVVIFEDTLIAPFRYLCLTLKKHLKNLKYQFETLTPPAF